MTNGYFKWSDTRLDPPPRLYSSAIRYVDAFDENFFLHRFYRSESESGLCLRLRVISCPVQTRHIIQILAFFQTNKSTISAIGQVRFGVIWGDVLIEKVYRGNSRNVGFNSVGAAALCVSFSGIKLRAEGLTQSYQPSTFHILYDD